MGLARYLSLVTSLLIFVSSASRVLAGSQEITAVFMGTSSFAITDGKTTFMIDGFCSRPPAWKLLLSNIRPDKGRIETCLARAGVTNVSGIFVAHTHYDHAMDAPTIARATGATLFGSESMKIMAAGERVPPAQWHKIEDGAKINVGAFVVDVIQTPHAPSRFARGEVSEPWRVPTYFTKYKAGSSFSFLLRHRNEDMSVLIVPSAGVRAGDFTGVKADTVFLSVGLLGKQTPEYISQFWQNTVRTVGAQYVVPIHWDDFSRPLEEPLRPAPRILDDVEAALSAISTLALSDGVALHMPKSYEVFHLSR